MAPLRSLAVVGTGLIGASVGLAARRVGVERVTGWDPDAAHLAAAEQRGAVEPAADLASALAGADLAVVAAPVAVLPAQVRAVLDASGPGCTVTDVGSTKGGVCAAAAGDGRFIGGHPICGSEARGPERATGELFEGATWFLTPVAATEPERYKLLHGFVSALGAIPVAVAPEAHDRLVAVTSHLPHALANVLLNHAGGARVDGHEPLAAAGGSLRDMTRIAGANPRIWVDIFLENREPLAAALAEHRRRIEQVESALAAGDAGFLARWIGEASANRRRLLETAYDDPGALQRLRVHVPDRPGVIAGIAQALGAERINIADFDLQHLSTDRGGTLTILVTGEQEAERAAAILETQGYGVVVAPVLDDDALDADALGKMKIEPASSILGHLAVPGDKSISHRAVLLAAIADGETRITGFGRSTDTEATIAAVRALGVRVYEADAETLRVFGAGLRGLKPPQKPIDCCNSGTLMRLLPGILAGQEGSFRITGDESLSARPMERIAEPLRRMGVAIETTDGHAPLTIEGGDVQPISYELPVASAQVKSAVLLAGLFARDGETTVVEPLPVRDHTETMLEAGGAKIRRRQKSASVWPVERLELGEIEVPGDFSSAAPLVVATTLLAGSELTVHGVNLNPRRIGLLDVLERMGGRVTVFNRRRIGGEAGGDIDVRSAQLVGTDVNALEVPLLVDELPLFALLAVHAHGDSVLRGAAELRAKETDRIEAVVDGLRSLGAHIRATEDGFVVRGVPTRMRGGSMDSRGDHRIAMLAAIAGLVSREGVEVEGAESVAVSFPGFYDLLESLRQ